MKVGITGGIGSGKTTVCRVFSILGIPVFAADIEANTIMETDPSVVEEVNSIAGKDIYTNGTLNRNELAAIIFNDKKLLEKINRMIHPIVRKNFDLWQKSQDAAYVIFEAAILLDSGSFGVVDKIITVTAPLEERIERVVKRNSLSREQILERVRNQSSDEYKVARSDYVIDNSDNRLIIPEILRIHEEIIKQIK